MRTSLCVIIALFSVALLNAQDAESILKKVDENLSAKTRYVEAEMIIRTPRGERKIVSRSWIMGEEKAFTEYLSPPREKGTKMLKLADKLWIYSPASDRVIQISGHMLRQSVMGSDLSYEDMMEDSRLRENYSGQVTDIDTLDGKICWVLSLTAKSREVSYYKRIVWVDTLHYLPVRTDLYGVSEKLLKRITFSDFRKIGNRIYPFRMTFKDMLKSGEGTIFRVKNLKLDISIPERYFSRAVLRK